MFQFGSSVRYVRDVNLFSSSEFMCLDQCCQSSLHKSLFGSLFRTVPFLLKLLLFKLTIWPQILLQCPKTITKCECWCPEMWLFFFLWHWLMIILTMGCLISLCFKGFEWLVLLSVQIAQDIFSSQISQAPVNQLLKILDTRPFLSFKYGSCLRL